VAVASRWGSQIFAGIVYVLRTQIGERWQRDAAPHRWALPFHHRLPRRNLLDDGRRLCTGSQREEHGL
jgi:hypothetical protein